MIELSHVVKMFAGVPAVDNISLSVSQGEFFGFLGPNGAGKTTTIKLLAGVYSPTSGSCAVGGFDVHRQPLEAKSLLAYVPDQPFLYEKLTGREFLQFIGGLYTMESTALIEGIENMSAAFELADFLDRRADEYSQGMRQRVVLASAFLHHPRVLVIDEPLVGLDPRSARLVKDMLKKKSESGVTIFMSTHLLDIVEELCDRIAIIHQGRIIHEQKRTAQGFGGPLESLFLNVTR